MLSVKKESLIKGPVLALTGVLLRSMATHSWAMKTDEDEPSSSLARVPHSLKEDEDKEEKTDRRQSLKTVPDDLEAITSKVEGVAKG